MIKKTFKIESNLKQIRPVVKDILGYLKEMDLKNDLLDSIKLASEEALINAVKHGNKSKEELPVIVELDCAAGRISIAVQDGGAGYNYHKIPDPTRGKNISKNHGRGVFLIKRLMDEVRFNKAGNRIEMIKYVK